MYLAVIILLMYAIKNGFYDILKEKTNIEVKSTNFEFAQNLPYWEKLKNVVLQTDLIVDKLVFKDIQLTATNDDQYFVFEDILYQVNANLHQFLLFNDIF